MRPDPIFILGAHKSGTSLLRSLFDGLDDHYVIPIETHCFQLLNAWIRYPFRKQTPRKGNKAAFKKLAQQWIHQSNINDDEYSDGLTLNWFDENIFSKTLTQKLNNCSNYNRRHLIDSYFEAIYASANKGKKLDSNHIIVEKSVENVEFAIDLAKMYPNSKFIHIIRNPYSNLVSLRKYKSSNGYPYLDTITRALFESYYFLYRNEHLIHNYNIVKYEYLTTHTEEAMKEICSSIGLPFNKKMLIPTKAGEKWRGNSMSGETFKNVSDERLERWKADIYPVEIAIVNKVFAHILKRFEYAPVKSSPKKFLRCKAEMPKKYIANRLFLARA